MNKILKKYVIKAQRFEDEVYSLLSKFDSIEKPRIIILSNTRKKLSSLSLRQEELFEQSLNCAEFGMPRAAIILGWVAFIDYFVNVLDLHKVHKAKPNWKQYKNLSQLIENVPEYQLIEAGRDISLINKPEMKSLLGLLSKRNECAHPSHYAPDNNEAIGYISELLNRIASIDKSKSQS